MNRPQFAPYSKAITAGITALLGSVQVAWSDQMFTTPEVVTIVIATLAAGWGVYAVPNSGPVEAAPVEEAGVVYDEGVEDESAALSVDPERLADALEERASELRAEL